MPQPQCVVHPFEWGVRESVKPRNQHVCRKWVCEMMHQVIEIIRLHVLCGYSMFENSNDGYIGLLPSLAALTLAE
eukprot:m.150261 g.150261  ORF g.150261 m.150261 type:complete len:75 (-) comp23291_c0_seq1:127-351(-)